MGRKQIVNFTRISTDPFPVIRFGNILKEHRKEKGLTQAELADQLGVFRNTIANWEADRATPDFETLATLCTFLEITKEELFGLQGANGDLTDDERKLLKNYRELSTISKRMLLRTAFSMLQVESEEEGEQICRSFEPIEEDTQQYAAGSDEPWSDDKKDALFIRKTPISMRADFITHVKGHSMEPAYHDGDLIYCKRASDAIPGQDVVCTTTNGKLIKRINENGMLFSVNPAPEYKVRIMLEDDDLHIKGIVLGIVKQSDLPSQRELITLNELSGKEMRAFREQKGIDNDW